MCKCLAGNVACCCFNCAISILVSIISAFLVIFIIVGVLVYFYTRNEDGGIDDFKDKFTKTVNDLSDQVKDKIQ